MLKVLNLFIIINLLLIGCTAHRNPPMFRKPPINTPSDDAGIKLAEAATAINESMMEMARVEKVILPPNKGNTITIPNTLNLQARASVDWSGPIEELTARIAKAAHYRFRVLGKEPSVPILVSVSVQDDSLAAILRNIDYQAGRKANIYAFPKSQVIELRYAKFYS